jgi:hypothetical protein
MSKYNQCKKIADRHNCVGPVLQSGHLANAVVNAIMQLNDHARVVDRGAYIRVLVPKQCLVTASAIEDHLGSAFQLPVDLEKIMTAFRGKLNISQNEASWTFISSGGRQELASVKRE